MAKATATKPQVSIVMPAFNAAHCIERAIASVQAQSLTNWELIVVNDASTDTTAKVVKALMAKDARIRLIDQKTNGGPSVARNTGFAAATAPWVGILDADDAYTPERLETLLKHATSAKLDMLADNQLFYDFYAEQVSRVAFASRQPVLEWNLKSHLQHDRHGTGFTWGLLKPLFRRDFLEKYKLAYREEFRYGEDSLLYMEALAKGAKAQVLAVPGYFYTTRVGEISGKGSGMSQTSISLKQHMATYDWFEAHYPAEAKAAKRWIDRCRAAARVSHDANKAKDCLKKRDFGQAATLLKDPKVAILLGQRLAQGFKKRIARAF